jgi:Delta3-Delta2-enoyl-CoA isomerase
MDDVLVTKDGEIATVCLARGKVNALNDALVGCLHDSFRDLEADEGVRSVVLIGRGKFFSFGFDVPEFMDYPKSEFLAYVDKFERLCSYLFQFPKPIIGALNGHTIAGGGMLAICCDHRIMVEGSARVSLNEITFGSTVFAGSVAILTYLVGSKNAQDILFSGKMYLPSEALEIGLIDEIAAEERFNAVVYERAWEYASKEPAAFRSLKGLLRRQAVRQIEAHEQDSLKEFIEIWYSESTRKLLRSIVIR